MIKHVVMILNDIMSVISTTTRTYNTHHDVLVRHIIVRDNKKYINMSYVMLHTATATVVSVTVTVTAICDILASLNSATVQMFDCDPWFCWMWKMDVSVQCSYQSTSINLTNVQPDR